MTSSIDPQRYFGLVTNGPRAGERIHVGNGQEWEPTWCCPLGDGHWAHHNHLGNGHYMYIGLCDAVGHQVNKVCGYRWDGGTGFHRHAGDHHCQDILPHIRKQHRCHCGETTLA